MSARPGLDELVEDVLNIVLEEHAADELEVGYIFACSCKVWWPTHQGEDREEYRAHVAEHVAAYLDTRLGEEPL